jgi:hypothetical protein
MPPQLPSERWLIWTFGPTTRVALKREPFPDATRIPPVGWKSAAAPEPEAPSAHASASIASETNVVRIRMGR